MAPKYPAIPEPTIDPASLRDAVLSLKQAFEILSGQRGTGDNAAVTPGEFSGAVSDINDSIDSITGDLSTKVSKAGDTMTGNLIISQAGYGGLTLNKTANSVAVNIDGKVNGFQRWLLRPGNDAAESSGNAGSNFDLHRYADNGAYLGQALDINRATGTWTIYGTVNFPNAVNFSGATTVANDFRVREAAGGDTGVTYLGTGSHYVQWYGPGATYYMPNGSLDVGGNITAHNGFYSAGLILATNSGTYNQFYTGSGNVGIYLGGSGDAQNYYRNTTHQFQNLDASLTYATFNSNGMATNYQVNAAGSILTSGNFHLNTSGNRLYFEGSNVVSLYWDGGNIRCSHNFYAPSGAGYFGSNLYTGYANASDGTLYFGSNGVRNINANSNTMFCNGGYDGWNIPTTIGSNPYQTNLITGNPNWNVIPMMVLHYPGNWAGVRWNGGGNSFDFHLNDSSAHKTSGAVTWVIDSDIRIKNVGQEYKHGLDEVAALRPVYFTYKRNVTYGPSDQEPVSPLDTGKRSTVTPVLEPEQLVYIGLVAQEAEGAMPELFTQCSAYIDDVSVDDLRQAEYTPLIFALVNCVKALKARIEVLEAGLG